MSISIIKQLWRELANLNKNKNERAFKKITGQDAEPITYDQTRTRRNKPTRKYSIKTVLLATP